MSAIQMPRPSWLGNGFRAPAWRRKPIHYLLESPALVCLPDNSTIPVVASNRLSGKSAAINSFLFSFFVFI
ncbi:hypothetical protein [Burkholderia sp. S-53]|uniref:hypothetical protein n=1 Tax=Burkholderia sp. S-53 TaxID=2906514 RepID=UPI0021D24CA0|nr:hypothetical protein [Burkholderia sp. S-53]UXU85655.1 hypothetical protein LXM88_04630 [Burkholderia sp. S-53]